MANGVHANTYAASTISPTAGLDYVTFFYRTADPDTPLEETIGASIALFDRARPST